MQIDKQIAMQSSTYIGYIILKILKQRSNCTIYDLYDSINKKHNVSSRQLTMGMTFLFSIGLIDFSEANIWLIK